MESIPHLLLRIGSLNRERLTGSNASRTRSHHGLALIWTCLLASGCAVIPKPDTCECSKCTLEPSGDANTRELRTQGSHPDTIDHEIIEICACRPWNRSGITVVKGQEYKFQIVESGEEWLDGTIKSTPENGWDDRFYNNLVGSLASPLKRSNEANWYALIGTIDKNDRGSFSVFAKAMNSSEDKSQRVSNESLSREWGPIEMTETGQLYFYANDMKGRYFNNKGSLRLKISRIR